MAEPAWRLEGLDRSAQMLGLGPCLPDADTSTSPTYLVLRPKLVTWSPESLAKCSVRVRLHLPIPISRYLVKYLVPVWVP